MKMLGIDISKNFLTYEGGAFWGYPIWPAPTLIAVNIIDESSEVLQPGDNQRDVVQMDYVLVDEGYDPASRVRKGRLFKRHGNSQPQNWHVMPHPLDSKEQFVANVNSSNRGVIQKPLASYGSFSLTTHLKNEGITRPLFLLGNKMEHTIWSLVDVEATVSGESLVYLKSRKVFGALPKLNTDAIPEGFLDRIQNKLDILAEDLYRSGPESVIDRCRDAATAILSAYLQQKGRVSSGKDLGDLAKAYESVEPLNLVVAGQAKTINRLHSRGKNAEQEKRGVRPPTEVDAELAVQAVGMILRDLHWAD
jgi:hypothetical protein